MIPVGAKHKICENHIIYKGASPAPLPGGRARVRPAGKRKKVFGVVRNEYYGQVDQQYPTPSPGYPWKGAW